MLSAKSSRISTNWRDLALSTSLPGKGFAAGDKTRGVKSLLGLGTSNRASVVIVAPAAGTPPMVRTYRDDESWCCLNIPFSHIS